MKRLLTLAALYALPATTHASVLDLTGYQEPSGSVTVRYQGDVVDPYFATKALLMADDMGLDIRNAAEAWITWGLRAQRDSGLFGRFRKVEGGWQENADADADDAMLALWIELLYRMAPAAGMPHAWKESAHQAEQQLNALYDPVQGIFHISSTMRVGLLMDNMEIYNAYRRIARDQKRLGMELVAGITNAKADLLGKHILQVFARPDGTGFLISTQPEGEDAFYPGRVAQIYPLFYGLPGYAGDAAIFSAWLAQNGRQWFKQAEADYSWGLVAVAALSVGDSASAACWRQHAEPFRYSEHWNVLEESALQIVKAKLEQQPITEQACAGVSGL